ncbi:hypothetical protein AB0F17_62005 [Nonomuraea sp. NPDC026600]|uniref:hypothetical protein n=1 Tax=Nonomuraea sp. NPDC026600 TaxID=3155363 RepID=UPI0033CA3D8E
MSRLYFATPTSRAELHGSEFMWLRELGQRPGRAAWELDRFEAFERAAEILSWVPEVPDRGHGEGYLHRNLREAQANPGPFGEREQDLISSLQSALHGNGLKLHIAGAELSSLDVEFNTALVAGSDPVRLAAKIGAWTHHNPYIEGPDRWWAANVIEEGLTTGQYRRTLLVRPSPVNAEPRLVDQGWDDVLAFLRERDDEPVVLHYSGDWGFPSPEAAAFELPEDEHGGADLAPWDALPDDRQWELAVAGLRRGRPWARLAPDTLAEVPFGPMVSVYDLFAPNRDERVRRAADLPLEETTVL